MEKDKYITEVIFRVDTIDTVFALFPYEIETFNGHVNFYQHVGQHSSADYDYCIKNSRLATKEEALDLKTELESIGYNLKVIKRRTFKKYSKSYRKFYGEKYM